MKNVVASAFQWWNNMWNIIHFEEINSTQTYAKENNVPPYTIIIARHQTAGVGQYGRVWEDIHQSVMLTAVLPLPKMPVALFTQYIALNIIEQLCVYRDDIQIKWPNDLVIGRKKLGGILTEVVNDMVYLGVGVNIVKPNVHTGIGLFQKSDEQSYQNILTCIVRAIQLPISNDIKKLERKHVYCQDGVYIESQRTHNVEITEIGMLKVDGVDYVDSSQFDVFYQ